MEEKIRIIKGGLFDLSDKLSEEEVFEELFCGASFRVERIISSGQASPPGFWYDQEEDEWVALLQGEAELEFEDGAVQKLKKGDWAFLPASLRHRVAATSVDPPCIWLAVFGPPADGRNGR